MKELKEHHKVVVIKKDEECGTSIMGIDGEEIGGKVMERERRKRSAEMKCPSGKWFKA